MEKQTELRAAEARTTAASVAVTTAESNLAVAQQALAEATRGQCPDRETYERLQAAIAQADDALAIARAEEVAAPIAEANTRREYDSASLNAITLTRVAGQLNRELQDARDAETAAQERFRSSAALVRTINERVTAAEAANAAAIAATAAFSAAVEAYDNAVAPPPGTTQV